MIVKFSNEWVDLARLIYCSLSVCHGRVFRSTLDGKPRSNTACCTGAGDTQCHVLVMSEATLDSVAIAHHTEAYHVTHC